MLAIVNRFASMVCLRFLGMPIAYFPFNIIEVVYFVFVQLQLGICYGPGRILLYFVFGGGGTQNHILYVFLWREAEVSLARTGCRRRGETVVAVRPGVT